jgi:hypothetical protein
MGKVLNFDKFIQEKNNEKIKVTVYGKEYEVPSRIPASVPIMMARAENAEDGQLATKLVMRAADAMFGPEVIDDFCNNGMSAMELSNLVKRLFDIINGKEDEDEEGEELSDDSGKKAVRSNGKK